MADKLYMNAAGYYRELEAGRGDIREASVSGTHAIYANSERLIYCMCAVMEEDVRDGFITIERRLIEEFCGEDGWLVVIGGEKFLEALSFLEGDGLITGKGSVMCRHLSLEDTKELFTSFSPINLFIKRPAISYQKEYRIVARGFFERNF